jgi:hypothetical protein
MSAPDAYAVPPSPVDAGNPYAAAPAPSAPAPLAAPGPVSAPTAPPAAPPAAPPTTDSLVLADMSEGGGPPSPSLTAGAAGGHASLLTHLSPGGTRVHPGGEGPVVVFGAAAPGTPAGAAHPAAAHRTEPGSAYAVASPAGAGALTLPAPVGAATGRATVGPAAPTPGPQPRPLQPHTPGAQQPLPAASFRARHRHQYTHEGLDVPTFLDSPWVPPDREKVGVVWADFSLLLACRCLPAACLPLLTCCLPAAAYVLRAACC